MKPEELKKFKKILEETPDKTILKFEYEIQGKPYKMVGIFDKRSSLQSMDSTIYLFPLQEGKHYGKGVKDIYLPLELEYVKTIDVKVMHEVKAKDLWKKLDLIDNPNPSENYQDRPKIATTYFEVRSGETTEEAVKRARKSRGY